MKQQQQHFGVRVFARVKHTLPLPLVCCLYVFDSSIINHSLLLTFHKARETFAVLLADLLHQSHTLVKRREEVKRGGQRKLLPVGNLLTALYKQILTVCLVSQSVLGLVVALSFKHSKCTFQFFLLFFYFSVFFIFLVFCSDFNAFLG